MPQVRQRVIAGRGGAGGGGDGGSAAISGVPSVRWSEVSLWRRTTRGWQEKRKKEPSVLSARGTAANLPCGIADIFFSECSA